MLGEYEYDHSSGASTVQTFEAWEPLETAVDLVSLQVDSNYGHPDYTCVYRFRVHGEPSLA